MVSQFDELTGAPVEDVERLPCLGCLEMLGHQDASEINQQALDWLGGAGDRPCFAFLNHFERRDPYLPTDDHPRGPAEPLTRCGVSKHQFLAQSFRLKPIVSGVKVQPEINSYDHSLSLQDTQVGRLVGELERRGLSERTLVFVTSDHGESFGKHDL